MRTKKLEIRNTKYEIRNKIHEIRHNIIKVGILIAIEIVDKKKKINKLST